MGTSPFYRHLRSTWERSVEELLFNRVVERYDRAVKTFYLAGVAVDQEAITAVHEGMTRCSKYIHDQPAAANFPLPTIEEMRIDLKYLKDFATSQAAKQKDAKQANAHLMK